jgi:hypothetical protein
MRDNKEAKGETAVNKTSLEDSSTSRVKTESQVRQGYPRLNPSSQAVLFFLVLAFGL